MDAHTISAAQGTSTAANTTNETPAYSREILGKVRAKLGGISIDQIEQQFRAPIKATARAAIELGMRLIFLKEMTPHGDWMQKLSLLGVNKTEAASMMACVVRILSLPESDRLIDAAGSKSKLFELLTLADEELSRLNQGEAVRGVSLTTLPKTSVHVLRSMLKGNGLAPMPPTAAPVLGNSESTTSLENVSSTSHFGLQPDSTAWGEADSKGATSHHLEDPADYPAVYTLLPGDYNGWPVSLIRHDGKTWLMASEVAAILAQDGDELDEIQGILDEWHRLGKPADSSLEIRLASTAMVVLVIDKLAVDLLNIRLNTPASAALAAWCADFDTPPALAEVKALHEAPAEITPDEALEELEEEYDQAHLMLHNLVAQIRGIHELSELSSGNQTKFSIRDMAGMLEISRNLVEGYELLFQNFEYGMMKIRRTLKRNASLPA